MYIGNDLQVAFPSYRIIDDISSGFNGSTTSFALVTNGTSPIPFPVNSQQVLISVNGVIQEPDPTGSAGFKLSGTNIVFSSAPANGHSFFGVILAGADYITAGTEFPDDTGWFRLGSGAAAFSSNGVKILDFDNSGLNLPDNKKVQLGTANDLQIYHDGSNSYIDDAGTGSLIIGGTSETLAKFTDDGSSELYYDNSKKFETTSAGVTVTGGIIAGGLTYPTSDGSANQVLKTDGSGNLSFVAQSSGTPGGSNTQLQYNNNGSFGGITGLTSDSTDVTFVGDNYNVVWDKSDDTLRFADSAKLEFGASGDLRIDHTGSHSIIEDRGSGDLRLKASQVEIQSSGGDAMAVFNTDGNSELYYDNSKKFETTSAGVTVTGGIIATGSSSTLELNGGVISVKNNGAQSQVRLYCESSNAHYVAVQAPAHSAFSGNPVLTLPATDGQEVVGTTETQTLTNKTLTSAVLNTGVSGSAILDEDNMASNSATQLATQQSIKAYVDANAGGGGSSPGGSNTQVQFNNSGSFGGSSNLTFDGTNLSVGGAVTAASAASSANGMRKITASTSAPSGGSDGDLWVRYTA